MCRSTWGSSLSQSKQPPPWPPFCKAQWFWCPGRGPFHLLATAVEKSCLLEYLGMQCFPITKVKDWAGQVDGTPSPALRPWEAVWMSVQTQQLKDFPRIVQVEKSLLFTKSKCFLMWGLFNESLFSPWILRFEYVKMGLELFWGEGSGKSGEKVDPLPGKVRYNKALEIFLNIPQGERPKTS